MTATHVSQHRFRMGEQNIFYNKQAEDQDPVELVTQTYTLQKETKQKLDYLRNELSNARDDLTRMGGGVVRKPKNNIISGNQLIFDGIELNTSPIMMKSGE